MQTIAISKFKATCLAVLERVRRTGEPVLLLSESGRVRLKKSPVAWIEDALSALPLRDATLTREVAIESRRVDLEHEDPADRFLAATASVYGLTLVTADDRLLGSRRIRTMANG